MPKHIFISYVYEDRPHRDALERWIANGQLGPEIVAVAEARDRRPDGETAVRQYLTPLIKDCAAIACLIGRDTHSHRWVQWELSVASSLGKEIILLRIPKTSGSAPTHHRHLLVHAFDPTVLRKLLKC